MASGSDPVAFRADLPLTSLGADSHSCGSTSMLHQAQMALGSDRAAQMSEAAKENRYPREFRAKVQRAFNLMTINGARAARLDDSIGSIAVEKLADLVIFDASTPSMICAAEQDPLVALVRHAGSREVNTVIVGGQILKEDGVLRKVDIAGVSETFAVNGLDASHESKFSWKQIARRLVDSRAELQKRIESVNVDLARRTILSMFGKSEEELFA
jgi:cytosine/adenosine deaminase-related metal-dependent hydrolase